MTDAKRNYRKAREAAGIKAEQAAVSLGVTITTLFNWERGATSPRAEDLCAMAAVYRTTTDHLLGIGGGA